MSAEPWKKVIRFGSVPVMKNCTQGQFPHRVSPFPFESSEGHFKMWWNYDTRGGNWLWTKIANIQFLQRFGKHIIEKGISRGWALFPWSKSWKISLRYLSLGNLVLDWILFQWNILDYFKLSPATVHTQMRLERLIHYIWRVLYCARKLPILYSFSYASTP